MLLTWSFKHFRDILIFFDNDKAFACLGEATYIQYTAPALPVTPGVSLQVYPVKVVSVLNSGLASKVG